MRATVLEALIVVLLGLAFALAANALSPRGLKLARNYFPGATRPLAPTFVATNTPRIATGTHAPLPPSLGDITARLRAKGLQTVASNQVLQLFRDPRYEQELVVFIDARNDQEYQEGHIPGAYQLDHYRVENYLGTVLPVCQTAEEIVVYCLGGDCEDSEFAALTLSQAGIPKTKLFVYGGGFTEWKTHGLPIEVGERKSGVIRPTSP